MQDIKKGKQMSDTNPSATGMLDSLLGGDTSLISEPEETNQDFSSESADSADDSLSTLAELDAPAAPPAPTYHKVKVKAGQEEREFELNPDDKELKEIIQRGLWTPKLQGKYDKLAQQLEKYKDYDSHKDKSSKLDRILELANKGYAAQAVKALFGDKYEDFRKSEIIGTIEYEHASPDQQARMDMEREKRERSLVEMQKDERIKELERRFEEKEEALETDKWTNVGVSLLQKYSMENFTADKELAAEQNDMIWEATWNTMRKYEGEWTPSVIEKIMRRKALAVRGGIQQTAEAKVQQITEDKKTKAKESAQTAVRKQQNPTSTGDLADRLRGSKSSLDKLNILLGRG